LALGHVKHCVTNCYFTKNRSFATSVVPRPPGTGETLLRTAHQLTVENDGIADTATLARGILRADVIREICLHLEPYQAGEKPITGETVIAKDLTIDSLAIMDMVMELEDRFDVSIPMSVIAEIHTVDQLADTIQDLRASRG
ncbi:MAG: acyl carrier protein, partial [Rhodospirillaceae bacterium]|nr:acyl carrier protein [Rhodospirillaceae bacterium]